MYTATTDATALTSYLYSWSVNEAGEIFPGSASVSADSVSPTGLIANLLHTSQHKGVTTKVGKVFIAGGQQPGPDAIHGTFSISEKISVQPGDELRLERIWPYGEATNVKLSIRPAAIAASSVDLGTVLAVKEDASNKGTPGGYAPLDADGKVPPQNLASLVTTKTHVVGSEAAQLDLDIEAGDLVMRSDTGDIYVRNDGDEGTMEDYWTIERPELVERVVIEWEYVPAVVAGTALAYHRRVDKPLTLSFDNIGNLAGATVAEGFTHKAGSAMTVLSLRHLRLDDSTVELAQMIFNPGVANRSARWNGEPDESYTILPGEQLILWPLAVGDHEHFLVSVIGVAGE